MSVKTKKQEKTKADVRDFASGFMKSNKEHHLNFEESIAEDDFISSGSMIMDSEIGGGFLAGLLRFCGGNECGKTSEALQVMYEMLSSQENSRGLFIQAEGRLGKKMKARSGVEFVYDVAEWVDGTCLVLQSNIYDFVFDFIRGIMSNNPNKTRFCMIIDSMDSLIPKDDAKKSTSEANKVAGGALLSSDFLRRVSLGMGKFGHLCILISQVRSTIKGQYESLDPNSTTSASGAHALSHYPNWVFEFERQFQKDKILEKPDQQMSDTNKGIGHYVKARVRKSDNETTGRLIKYPIKYGRNGGKSVWIEREIVDLLLSWGFFSKSGSWFAVEEELAEYIKSGGFEFPDKIQGMNKIYTILEDSEKLTLHLRKFVEKNILSA
jgi:RecA/RadA recombinase